MHIYMVCPSQLQSFTEFCWAVSEKLCWQEIQDWRIYWHTDWLNDGRVKNIISYATRCMGYNNIPSPKTALCQVWLKLAMWFWRIRFFNLTKWRSAFSSVSSLSKALDPSFEQTWIPSNLECSVPIWLKLAKWPWRSRLRYFVIISPLERVGPSFEYSSPKDTLC